MDTPSYTRISGVAIVFGAFFIGVGIFGAGATKAYSDHLNANILQRNLTVTGAASRVVTSDRAKWSVRMVRQLASTSGTVATPLERQIQEDADWLVRSLGEAGVSNPTVSRQPYQDMGTGNTFYGSSDPSVRTGGQTIVIETDRVKELAGATDRLTQALTGRGTLIDSNSTEYFLSDRDSLRRELFKEAMDDAKQQAESVVGDNLGELTGIANGGYLNVNPVLSYMNNTGYYSEADDTSSVEKRASITVGATYSLK